MKLETVVLLSKRRKFQELARTVSEQVFAADSSSEGLDIIRSRKPNLIVLDNEIQSSGQEEFVSSAREHVPEVPIIVIGEKEISRRDMNCSSVIQPYEYLSELEAENTFQKVVGQMMDKHRHVTNSEQYDVGCNQRAQQGHQNEDDFFIEECAASARMAGKSKATGKTLKMIKLVASSRCNPVLIMGETGTGKEPAAKAVHHLRNPNEKFVAVNCAALTANLLESELFGHAKGAFTGADREKTGLLEIAGRGTVLLDEISEMPVELQAKLLRVLQEKSFRKVGGVEDIKCRATIIASTNRDLSGEVKSKRFRRDLYYRLNICPITIAPLRSPQRADDIESLARYFLKTSDICPEKQNRIKSYTGLAVEALSKHDWPGNVRELRNVVERAILLETTDKIGLSSIIIESQDSLDYARQSQHPCMKRIKDFSLAKAESELIARALEETGWQKTRAAALLGITRATLYAKVKQYNIKKAKSCRSHIQESTYPAGRANQPVHTG